MSQCVFDGPNRLPQKAREGRRRQAARELSARRGYFEQARSDRLVELSRTFADIGRMAEGDRESTLRRYQEIVGVRSALEPRTLDEGPAQSPVGVEQSRGDVVDVVSQSSIAEAIADAPVSPPATSAVDRTPDQRPALPLAEALPPSTPIPDPTPEPPFTPDAPQTTLDSAIRLAELHAAHVEASSATVQSVNQRVLSIAERDIHQALMQRPPELYGHIGGMRLDEDERAISSLIEQSSARANAYAQSAAGITADCFRRCMVR